MNIHTIRTWILEKRERSSKFAPSSKRCINNQSSTGGFNDFKHHEYNYTKLEPLLLANSKSKPESEEEAITIFNKIQGST